LIELMIAMVFITIAFFGYVALHARILHSGQRLEEKEKVRAATDFYSAMLISRCVLGSLAGPDGKLFVAVPNLPGVYRLDTTKPLNIDWLVESILTPAGYKEGMDELMQLSPEILTTPYAYSWKKR
jgi:hypothetical protein